MSRSARNRAAHKARGIRPVGNPATLDRPARPAILPPDTVEPYGWTGTRRHGNRRPGRDKGGDTEWRTTSPYYRTTTTHDYRWDKTP